MFEKDFGVADLIEKSWIEKEIKYAKSKPQLVMILSCHSEESAKVFFEAGIEHVICIRRDRPINETACH